MTKETTTSDLVTVDDLTNLSLHYEIVGRHFRDLGAALRGGDTDAAAAAADKLAEQFENSSEIYRKVAQRKNAMLTLRGWMLMLILLVLMMGIMPGSGLAQEVTPQIVPEATPVVVAAPASVDPNTLMVLLALAIIVIGGLSAGGIGGLLITLNRINANPAIMRAAEQGYDKASTEKKQLIDLAGNLLGVAERLATGVVPAGSPVVEALSKAEDIIEEITDSVPLADKPPIQVTINAAGSTAEAVGRAFTAELEHHREVSAQRQGAQPAQGAEGQ